MKIVVVDYGIGNVQSIFNALSQFKGVHVSLTDNHKEILEADGVILPGVGAFKSAMEELKIRDLPHLLKKYTSQNKPLLGICLGMQLLFESSEEFGHTEGLSLVKGRVECFPSDLTGKLPHVGWNSIVKSKVNVVDTLFNDIQTNCDCYFVHSYICKPRFEKIITTYTEHGGIQFCSSIQQDNLFGCQFHPEKSGIEGLKILKCFVDIVKLNKQ